MSISERVKTMGESITLAITSNAKKMKQSGEDVIIMASGEPDFDTPDHIKKAAIEALAKGFTKYTAASGTDELKSAVCRKLLRDSGLAYKNENIIITAGGKQALFNAFLSIINSGDEVVLFSPYWVSYLEQIRMAGGIPVLADLEECIANPEKFASFLTERTKAVLFNSPANPSGRVIPEEQFRMFVQEAVNRDLFIISDEVYEKFLYDGNQSVSPASFSEQAKAKTIIINAFSKTYSMTGWRVGFAAGPKEVIKAMGAIQGHQTSNVSSISQKAALAALESSQECVTKMVRAFSERREYMHKRLCAIKGVICPKPEGAFYLFPDVSQLYKGGIKGSMDFCSRLLEEKKLAVIPGIGFGADKHIRFTYSASMNDIEKGMDRFESFCNSL
ncbi:MAG: pyridoxal phosphate-dependent aminotransferase [bacterium]|nr:pyridoxal phosphate-dependent aminotransferase [bacterium]